jgi:hypothetical protein
VCIACSTLTCQCDCGWMDRIATICASYCSEVEKYLSIARPGTFPDPDMLVRATCNHLIFQLHLWVLLASWATVINQAPKCFLTHKGELRPNGYRHRVHKEFMHVSVIFPPELWCCCRWWATHRARAPKVTSATTSRTTRNK